jgi:beta-lactamase regulating signal transducer with metallopeptidase domain/type II secretory pathway component GspD/PulD (secretin)
MSVNDLWQPIAWLGSGALVQLTWALLHFLWQGCAVAVVYAAVVRGLRRAPANARYVTGVAALLAMAACLPATLWLLPPPMETPAPPACAATSPSVSPSLATVDNPPAAVAPQTIDEPGNAVVVRYRAPSMASNDAPLEPAATDYAEYAVAAIMTSSPYVAAIYLTGVLAMLLRVALGLWSGRRLRGTCQPMADSALLEMLGRNARRMGMRAVPAVAYCQRICVPVVVGVLRPMILLPASVASGLTPSQLEAVLLHELAHVCRFDLAVNVFQRLVEALLFFHPAVWWLSRRVSIERENACDDVVLHLDHERVRYADALLRVAELCASGRIDRTALAATGGNASQFHRRVLRLLGIAEKPPLRLTTFGVVTAVLLMASVLFAPMVWRNAAHAEADSPKETASNEGSVSAPTEDTSRAEKEGLRVRAYHLKYTQARDAKKVLTTLLSPKGRLQLAVSDTGEIILASDNEETLNRIDRVVAAIDVKPPEKQPPKPDRPRPVKVQAASPSPTAESSLVTIHAEELDVRKVLELLSREAKAEIIVSPSVTGKLTIDVRNRTIDDALALIAKACNLVIRREGNIVFVSTRAEMRKAEEDNLPVRVYRLDYAKSSDVLKMISPLKSPKGKVTCSPDAGDALPDNGVGADGAILIFQDYEDVLKIVDRVIAQIDVRPPEVMIEAVLLQAKPGASFAAMDDAATDLAPATVLNAAGKATPGFADDHNGMRFGFISKNSATFIKALETKGEIRIITRPRLMVRNKQLGQIEFGGPSNRRAANAANEKMKLAFRPFASSDGMIRMEICLDHCAVKQNDKEIPPAMPLPVTTNVMMPDGQTIVIGFGPDASAANDAAKKEWVLVLTATIVKSPNKTSSASERPSDGEMQPLSNAPPAVVNAVTASPRPTAANSPPPSGSSAWLPPAPSEVGLHNRPVPESDEKDKDSRQAAPAASLSPAQPPAAPSVQPSGTFGLE